MKAVLSLLVSLFTTTTAFATLTSEIRTVPYVNIENYLGAWYVIASQPTQFEHDCFCSRQVISRKDEKKFNLDISCNRYSPQGKLKQLSGSAKNVDPNSNSKLRATFKIFFKVDYWIIGLADDYSWSVVTDPDGDMLYILSKTPNISRENYQEALRVASQQRDISKLQIVSHAGCSYPSFN